MENKKKQKITLLDLGGVVFQSTGLSNKRINWEVINKLNHKYGYDLNIGLGKFPDFLNDYNIETNQNFLGIEFLESVFDTLEINRELIYFLQKESKIIIVSDNYRENIEYISERYNFKEWSIKQIYSFDYKMEKSNPKFFEKLLEDLKEFDKKNMIFIDDSLSKIKSAKMNGIKGIQYQGNALLFRAFKEQY